MGERGGRSSSTPPSGAKRARMAVARFSGNAGWWLRVVCRISRTSASRDRPFLAARMRSRRFSASSRLRTMMLVMTESPSPTSCRYSNECVAVAMDSRASVRASDLEGRAYTSRPVMRVVAEPGSSMPKAARAGNPRGSGVSVVPENSGFLVSLTLRAHPGTKGMRPEWDHSA